MKICHVCGLECTDDTELCPICGAELSNNPINEESPEKTANTIIVNPVLAASVDDVVTAEIFRDVLTENGIMFSCDSEDGGSMRVVFGGDFVAEDIYVSENDLDRAQELYEEILNSEPEFDEDFFADEDLE